MNSNLIQKDLIGWAQSNASDIVAPNYFLGWYECDLIKISKSNQLTEYEIKVSRSDFKNDALKGHQVYTGQMELVTTESGHTYNKHITKLKSKHDEIREGKRCNRFYFVVPEGLVKPEEVPADFGLIYATETKWRNSTVITFQIVKMSKLFKGKFADEKLFRHLACNLTLKLRNSKQKIYSLNQEKKAFSKISSK